MNHNIIIFTHREICILCLGCLLIFIVCFDLYIARGRSNTSIVTLTGLRPTVGPIVGPTVASTVESSKRLFKYRSNRLNQRFDRINVRPTVGPIVGPTVGPTSWIV